MGHIYGQETCLSTSLWNVLQSALFFTSLNIFVSSANFKILLLIAALQSFINITKIGVLIRIIHICIWRYSRLFVVFDRIFVAKISRDGKNEKELSVKAGDIVEVCSWKYFWILLYINICIAVCWWSPIAFVSKLKVCGQRSGMQISTTVLTDFL